MVIFCFWVHFGWVSGAQCDKIGRFRKVLDDKYSEKVAQIFWALLVNITFDLITTVTTFYIFIQVLLFIPLSGHTGGVILLGVHSVK